MNYETISPMLNVLDAMEHMMTGTSEFDRLFYQNLHDCMTSFDASLPMIQNAAWQGFIDYWNMGGTPSDPWGGFPTNYSEHNISTTNLYGMVIFEPCDYSSNMAYYHDVMEFCNKKSSGKSFFVMKDYQDAIGKAFSNLALGSAFMHGSNTILGRQQDRWPLRAVAYLIHQASLSSLTSDSSILHDLTDHKRARTAIEIVEDFQNMYLTEPVTQWYNTTESFDIPRYELSFAGLISTALTIGFDDDIVDTIIPLLIRAFNLPEELRNFVVNQYIPAIRNATSLMEFGDIERFKFLSNAIGSGIKLMYAFLWQERELTKSKFFLDPLVNFLGWELLPRINHIANQFVTFEHFDKQFQNGVKVYPGESWCNPVIPHAKWHLESGLGLLDLTYLADEIARLLSN